MRMPRPTLPHMTRYQVDSDAVRSTSSAVHASIGRIQAEVSALHGHLASLESSWSGAAAAAFQTSVADWRSTEQHVSESLAALNAALGQAGQQYEDVEAAAARMFAR